MIRIAICDDETAICNQLENVIFKYGRENYIQFDVEIFNSGLELLQFMKNEHNFNLIFLDIQMDGMNGVEVGKIIREEMNNQTVQIVYISAQTSYCMELFDIRPMNFLEKPLTTEKIFKLLALAVRLQSGDEQLFIYKQGHTSYKEYLRNILYFEAQNRTVKMVTDTKEVTFYSTFHQVHSQISNDNFILIHKSYLINYAHVIEFGTKELKMSNNQTLPISQQRRNAVKELQMQFEKEFSY